MNSFRITSHNFGHMYSMRNTQAMRDAVQQVEMEQEGDVLRFHVIYVENGMRKSMSLALSFNTVWAFYQTCLSKGHAAIIDVDMRHHIRRYLGNRTPEFARMSYGLRDAFVSLIVLEIMTLMEKMGFKA